MIIDKLKIYKNIKAKRHILYYPNKINKEFKIELINYLNSFYIRNKNWQIIIKDNINDWLFEKCNGNYIILRDTIKKFLNAKKYK